MPASTTLLQFLLMLLAGWLQRQQAAVIEYLKAENRALRERLGGRRIIFTDAERRHLAEKARAVGRKGLRELGTIDARRCFAGTASCGAKWTSLKTPAGRPRKEEWWGGSHGQREPELGLHAHPRGDEEPRSQAGPRDDSRAPERARHRARSRARQGDAVVGVLESALESPGCG